MIHTLKKEIERKIDREIKNRGDCEFLSLMILEVLDETISYNTLKRFFGLTKFTKPNIKTLNILDSIKVNSSCSVFPNDMRSSLPQNRTFDPPILPDGIEKSKIWALVGENYDVVDPVVN